MRQRRGSGRFHCGPGGVRVSKGFPLCVTGAPAVHRAAIPAPGRPLSRDSRSVLGTAIPRCPLSRDTPSISRFPLSGYPPCLGMSSMSGYPLYSEVSSIPVFPISGCSLCPEVPSIPGYPSGHGRAGYHVKQFQIKFQFQVSPNASVSRESGAALPCQSSGSRTGLAPRGASVHGGWGLMHQSPHAAAEVREIRKYSE